MSYKYNYYENNKRQKLQKYIYIKKQQPFKPTKDLDIAMTDVCITRKDDKTICAYRRSIDNTTLVATATFTEITHTTVTVHIDTIRKSDDPVAYQLLEFVLARHCVYKDLIFTYSSEHYPVYNTYGQDLDFRPITGTDTLYCMKHKSSWHSLNPKRYRSLDISDLYMLLKVYHPEKSSTVLLQDLRILDKNYHDINYNILQYHLELDHILSYLRYIYKLRRDTTSPANGNVIAPGEMPLFWMIHHWTELAKRKRLPRYYKLVHEMSSFCLTDQDHEILQKAYNEIINNNTNNHHHNQKYKNNKRRMSEEQQEEQLVDEMLFIKPTPTPEMLIVAPEKHLQTVCNLLFQHEIQLFMYLKLNSMIRKHVISMLYSAYVLYLSNNCMVDTYLSKISECLQH
jgi:hypothetical protein